MKILANSTEISCGGTRGTIEEFTSKLERSLHSLEQTVINLKIRSCMKNVTKENDFLVHIPRKIFKISPDTLYSTESKDHANKVESLTKQPNLRTIGQYSMRNIIDI